MPFDTLASSESVATTQKSLEANGISVHVVTSGDSAKAKIIELIPKNAEVMNMTSMTLDTISAVTEIQDSGNYDSVKAKLMQMNRETQGSEMQKLGAAPDWAIGSVHAVTEEGTVMIASQSGSQLPAYAYGAPHVIWVVGTHKIVKNMDEGFKRIYERSLPLEEVRARKAYHIPADKPGSSVNKILIVKKEVTRGRITIILVNEVLGF